MCSHLRCRIPVLLLHEWDIETHGRTRCSRPKPELISPGFHVGPIFTSGLFFHAISAVCLHSPQRALAAACAAPVKRDLDENGLALRQLLDNGCIDDVIVVHGAGLPASHGDPAIAGCAGRTLRQFGGPLSFGGTFRARLRSQGRLLSWFRPPLWRRRSLVLLVT